MRSSTFVRTLELSGGRQLGDARGDGAGGGEGTSHVVKKRGKPWESHGKPWENHGKSKENAIEWGD